MKQRFVIGLSALLLAGSAVVGRGAQAPQNVGVTFNGETEALDRLAADAWHTITASYRYPGRIDVLTNTFVVLARGGDLLSGLDVGYNLPANQLMIVKHGFWNATEATGQPGERGRILENDQAYVDCENTAVQKTADEISVSYRVKFKPHVLQGVYNVYLYVEDREVNHDGFTMFGSVTIDREVAVHRTDMPPQWFNSLQPKNTAAAPLTLAEDAQARYTLVIPADAKRIEVKAASDLGFYLKLISDADFAVVRESELPADGAPGITGPAPVAGERSQSHSPGRYISVGRTARLANSACQWKVADLAAEGYALEVQGENVYLYGGSGRGLLHGVYSLLEEDLGCRWYSTTSVDTPQARTLAVRLAPRKYLPVLELRDPYIHKLHDPNWSLRNKTNTPHAQVPLAWGGSIRFHNMGHTYAGYFPTERYFAEHPEYYALVNGKRQPSQLCHTNEDVIRLSIEKTCEIFRDHPEVTVTAIGPNDGRGFCDCPNCQQLDDENGGRSGSYFYHVNRIAEGVKREFPNNHLISLAYLDYAMPPSKLRVDDYIIIQLCTDSHAWKYQFCFLDESPDFPRMIQAWQAVHARVFIWDYTTDYVHFLVPLANWPVIAANTRFNIRHGATGVMYESELNDVDEMRGWVWAKQLWNPDLDTQTLLKDFVFGYYKEAAEPLWDYQQMMWDYWERWHRQPHRCGEPSDNPLLNNLHCSYAPDGPMFTPEFMARMRQAFEEAERRAKSDEILTRVKRAKLSLLYLELAQHLGYFTEFGDFVYGQSLRQPPAAKQVFQPRLNEFTAICQQHGLTTLGIPVTLAKVTAKWQTCVAAEEAALPKMYLPAEWIFRPDPADKGVVEKWAADATSYEAARQLAGGSGRGQTPSPPLPAGLHRLHVNRGVGWEQQGFAGFDGYGWYFQDIEIPAELLSKVHLYLDFLQVNEQAWVYLNGELACERSYAATGKGAGELGAAFSFDAKKWLKPGCGNRIAVRVRHSVGLGGILQPAMLVATDDECSTGQLDRFRY